MARVIVVDTETTGFKAGHDEILQIGIVGLNGETLFNEHFKPEHMTEWPEAEAVNGISPEDVKDKPFLKDRLEEVQKHFADAKYLVGYNTNFDFRFLQAAGIKLPEDCKLIDVMLSFAPVKGEKADWTRKGRTYNGFRCQKLVTAAEYFGYDWNNEGPHDAVGDAKATAFVLRELYKDPQYKQYITAEEWLRPEEDRSEL